MADAATPEALERCRIAFLGRKGPFADMLAGLGSLAPEARRETGARINDAKSRIAAAIEARVASAASGSAPAALDVTLPGRLRARGSAHPIAIVTEDFVGEFVAMGFERA
ncbi:MAG: phenylalanine--tRNA ligase subunit alpha, partial [bacterium]